jgi:flagellar biosynthesis anti-sigma factor FlgM
MRIDPNQAAQVLPETTLAGSSGGTSAAAQTSGSGALGEDQALLSGAHTQVQALAAQALQFPEVRQEKVNALRQVVANGSYQPSPAQVADAVFGHMLSVSAA